MTGRQLQHVASRILQISYHVRRLSVMQAFEQLHLQTPSYLYLLQSEAVDWINLVLNKDPQRICEN
jgi:hypothetical protein